MDTNVPVDNNAIAIDGLKQQDSTEGAARVPAAEPTTTPKKAKSPAKKIAPPKTGMACKVKGWQLETGCPLSIKS
jgi:hypothetical protein